MMFTTIKAFLFNNRLLWQSASVALQLQLLWGQCSSLFFSTLFLMSKMLLLTLSLFTPLCSLCKDSVHTDLIGSKGTPIHLLPNGIASSRGEGWHSPCQGDGEVLLLIIAVDGGNNLSRHQARQLSIKAPLLHFHLRLLLLLPSAPCAPRRLPFPLLFLRRSVSTRPNLRPGPDLAVNIMAVAHLTRIGVGGGGGGCGCASMRDVTVNQAC